jgi:catechol 2,3-dioxygenase-like lactoylglutathione lyase family enzyme
MTISLTHDHVGITVGRESLDATIDWYSRNLGFAIERRFDSHGTTFVFLVSGQAKIELVVGASRPHEAPADNILTSMDPERLHHFCVAVEDLDTAVSQLRDNGVSLIGGPMDVAEIGQRIAFITDNLGTIIELTEPGTWGAGRGH